MNVINVPDVLFTLLFVLMIIGLAYAVMKVWKRSKIR